MVQTQKSEFPSPLFMETGRRKVVQTQKSEFPSPVFMEPGRRKVVQTQKSEFPLPFSWNLVGARWCRRSRASRKKDVSSLGILLRWFKLLQT